MGLFKISLLLTIILLNLPACNGPVKKINDKAIINQTIDKWHLAATNADTTFFDYLDSDAVYIGTDATERWTKDEFTTYAIPYFKKGKAWDFKPIEREIYCNDNENIAWFNETLNTWMGICRSSGVMHKDTEGNWKIKQYHLSCTVPNDKVKDFIKMTNQNDTIKE